MITNYLTTSNAAAVQKMWLWHQEGGNGNQCVFLNIG